MQGKLYENERMILVLLSQRPPLEPGENNLIGGEPMLPRFEDEDIFLPDKMHEEIRELNFTRESIKRITPMLQYLHNDCVWQLTQERESHYINRYELFVIMDVIIDTILKNKENYSVFFEYIGSKRDKFNPNPRS